MGLIFAQVSNFDTLAATTKDEIVAYIQAALPVVLSVAAIIIGVMLLVGLFKWLAHSIAG